MDIIEEVIQARNEIDYGIHNHLIDFMTYRYPPEKRRKLKTELTNQIAPLLASKGFVKKNSCFFRVHGDALLQIIGVVYPHNYTFYVASIVQPMYDFFHPLSTEGTTYHDLIGLRNNHCPDEARAIEHTLELLENGKILSAQRDYEKAFRAIYLLLEREILPRLDACVNGRDCIEYNQYGRIVSLWRAPVAMISLYYRDHMIKDCMTYAEACLKAVNKSIKEVSEAELLPYPQNFPPELNEKFRAFYEEWYQNKQKSLERLTQTRNLLETIADCVNRKDDQKLKEMMDQSTILEHAYLEKVCKAFGKEYPLQQILNE